MTKGKCWILNCGGQPYITMNVDMWLCDIHYKEFEKYLEDKSKNVMMEAIK